jgi:SAM-dependent methyltransferase
MHAILGKGSRQMIKIGGSLGLSILNAIAAAPPGRDCDQCMPATARLALQFGNSLLSDLKDKTIIDFGCGDGRDAVATALAAPDCRLIGLDIQQKHLDRARARAVQAGVEARCLFAMQTTERADLILSFDAFEHFSDPAAILDIMSQLLKPGGAVLASFGPTWLHPYGGHFFSVFPWAHLLFSERALIEWRARFRSDGARCFGDVDGGLNQIRIAGFERLVEASPLKIDWLSTEPIRGIGLLRHRRLREFGSSLVRCRMVPRDQSGQACTE